MLLPKITALLMMLEIVFVSSVMMANNTHPVKLAFNVVPENLEIPSVAVSAASRTSSETAASSRTSSELVVASRTSSDVATNVDAQPSIVAPKAFGSITTKNTSAQGSALSGHRVARNANGTQQSASSSNSAAPTTPKSCCPELVLNPYSLDFTVANSCKHTCIRGISVSGFDCTKKISNGKWTAVTDFFDTIVTVEGNFILVGLDSCSFSFDKLESIRGVLVQIQTFDGSSNFMPKLAVVQSSRDDCYLHATMRDVSPKTQPSVKVFDKAVAEGQRICQSSRPSTLPPPSCPPTQPLIPGRPVGAGPNHATSSNITMVSQDSKHGNSNTDQLYFWISIALGGVLGVILLANMGAGIFVTFVNTRQKNRAFISIKFFTATTTEMTPVQLAEELVQDLGQVHKKEEKEEEERIEAGQPGEEMPYDKLTARYDNVTCKKRTRVKLVGLTCDFIHANYVRSAGGAHRFIAAQGPISSTTFAFYFMAVQEKSDHIIMVTDATEYKENKALKKKTDTSKCYEYYPLTKNETVTFEQEQKVITVTCEDSSMFIKTKKTQIRKTTLAIEYADKVHKVIVWHYLHWPDHGVPAHVDGALPDLLMTTLTSKHPIIVHCSAGIGRTGTVIMVGYMLDKVRYNQKLESGREILLTLRKDRRGLVQDATQYLYAHQVVLVWFREYCGLGKELEKKHDVFTKEYEKALVMPRLGQKEKKVKQEKKEKKVKDQSVASNAEASASNVSNAEVGTASNSEGVAGNGPKSGKTSAKPQEAAKVSK